MVKMVLSTALLILVLEVSSYVIRPPPYRRDKWVVFGTTCYRLIVQELTWEGAQKNCKAHNASLVNIGSYEEEDIVGTLAHTTIWIGLNDIGQEGRFTWADTDQEPTYANWMIDDPEGQSRGKYEGRDCIALVKNVYFQWIQINCRLMHASMCEKSFDCSYDD